MAANFPYLVVPIVVLLRMIPEKPFGEAKKTKKKKQKTT